MTVAEPRSFRDLTTMRVGGPASRLIEVRTADALAETIAELAAGWDDWIVLAGGSNTIVCDEGFAGTTVLIRTEGIERYAPLPGDAPDTVRLRVEAGHSWDDLVRWAVQRGFAGVEALSGIPGTVGAGAVQNIGAYGQEISEVLHGVTVFDLARGERVWLPAAELGLGYRTSVLKRGWEAGAPVGVVLDVHMVLRAPDSGVPATGAVRYAQLAEALNVPIGQAAPLEAVRAAVLTLRASKGMLLDPANPDSASAGSFFTNPVLTAAAARSLPAGVPTWPIDSVDAAPAVTPLAHLAAGGQLRHPDPVEPARVKVSAAWLIERAGVPRGFALPGSAAAISSAHTLALTNRGGATTAEVLALARYVQARVLAEFGVHLVPEPVLIGCAENLG